MDMQEVQRRFEIYQLDRNITVASKCADNKGLCALEDIAPDLVKDILIICRKCYDEGYTRALDEIGAELRKIN